MTHVDKSDSNSDSHSHPGYALRYHSPTRLVRTYFRTCLRIVLRRDARRNTQGGAAADAANPRLFRSHAGVFPCTPFFGGAGMMPACPKSLATVSDGCAPTLSQYLRFGVRNGDRQDGSGSSGQNGDELASPVPARRANNPKSREGRRSRSLARGRTWRGRFSVPCVCFHRSLRRQRGRDAGGQREGEVDAGRLCCVGGSPRTRTRFRIVVPDDFDVLPVAGCARVRDVDAIKGKITVPVTGEPNSHGHHRLARVSV